ncbi:MAG: DUF4411 family protein [Dehalococcoidales bacterium]|nr:DUF4411 family protein [Dehalococcoidales bacterium]
MVHKVVYDYYSVDAGILMRMKDMLPHDVFQPAWDEISRLALEGKWKIFDVVASEVHGDFIQKWLADNSSAVVKFNPTINSYINKLMQELQKRNMTLVDPESLKNNGDPFVIMLALYLEGRDPDNLLVKNNKTCCVLTREELKSNKVNIPSVCEIFHIPHMTLHEFMKHHGWEINLTVHNP